MSSLNDRVLIDSIIQQKHSELAPELPDDKFFELFVAEHLLWDRDLSWEELENGIAGGGDDGGIDAIYIFRDGKLLAVDEDAEESRAAPRFELIVIQSKRTPSFSESAIDKLQVSLPKLLDLTTPLQELTSLYNEDVIAWFDRFRKSYVQSAARFPSFDVNVYYASRGFSPNSKVIRKAKLLCDAIVGLFSSCTCDVHFVTPSDLVEVARRQRPATLDLPLNETISTTSGGLVGLASISDYFDFITGSSGELRTAIFESNVRDYEGSSGINASIRATLDDSAGDDFWWLNNGVTIVAARAAQYGKRITLEYPQIVNGLQTSREIYEYVSRAIVASEDSFRDDRAVLVRIVVPPSEASRDRIIRATNSQTAIPSVALRATDKIQRDIEEYFLRNGWFYERRKNRYQNEGKPIARIVTIPYLAESVLAIVLKEPHLGSPRLGGRFLRDDRLYSRIFTESISLGDYLMSARLVRLVEGCMRRGRKSSSADVKRNSQARYLLPTVMAIAAEKTAESGELATLDLISVTSDDIQRWTSKAREFDRLRRGRPDINESEVTQGLLATLASSARNVGASEQPEVADKGERIEPSSGESQTLDPRSGS